METSNPKFKKPSELNAGETNKNLGILFNILKMWKIRKFWKQSERGTPGTETCLALCLMMSEGLHKGQFRAPELLCVALAWWVHDRIYQNPQKVHHKDKLLMSAHLKLHQQRYRWNPGSSVECKKDQFALQTFGRISLKGYEIKEPG